MKKQKGALKMSEKQKEELKYRPINLSIEKSNFRLLNEKLWFEILDYLNVIAIFKLE